VFCLFLNTLIRSAIAGLTLFAVTAHAASVEIDFATDGNYGRNALIFNKKDVKVTTRGFTLGQSYRYGPYLRHAKIKQQGPRGLEVCSHPRHCFGNYQGTELISFEFDQDVAFKTITIKPASWHLKLGYSARNGGDTSGTALAGNQVIYGKANYSLAELGFAPVSFRSDLVRMNRDGSITLGLEGTGNSLLLGGSAAWGGFKVIGLQVETVAVPLPAAGWLFFAGLMGLIGIRRSQR